MMSVRIYPYPTMSGTISLQLSGGGLDDSGWPRVPYIPDRQLVELYDLDKESWSIAGFDVEVTLPADELARSEEEGNVVVLLSIECSRTLYRQVIRLRRDKTGSNRWTGRLEAYRQNLRGTAIVAAVVAGTVEGRVNRFLGRSSEWTLHFDEPAVRPATGTMKVRWVDFEHPESGLEYLTDYADREFFTDMQSEVPTLYLNKAEAFDGLPALLEDRRRAERDLPLHNAERVSIARSVWMGLINTSVASIQVDADGLPEWPLEEWKRVVLKRALAKALPVLGDDERLQEAHEAWKAPERAAGLESKLQLAVDDLASAGKLLRRSLKILKSSKE